ncbi:kinetochore protein Spc24 [Cyanocitta cristata]
MRGTAPPGSNAARVTEPRDKERKKMATAGAAPLEELEELSQELLRELRSGCTEELLRRGLERRERMETRLLETQSKARDIAKDLAEAEAKVLQRFQEVQADVQRLRGRSRELDTELEQARGMLSGAKDKTQALRLELEELQEQLRQLEEDKEDPSIPPDVYMAQVYYEISRIDWDCSAGPGRIRGIHYGPDIAVPLDMDEAQHSRTFISDYLWGLVPTEWRPRRPPVLPREPTSP